MPRSLILSVTISFFGAVGPPRIVARLPDSRCAIEATSCPTRSGRSTRRPGRRSRLRAGGSRRPGRRRPRGLPCRRGGIRPARRGLRWIPRRTTCSPGPAGPGRRCPWAAARRSGSPGQGHSSRRTPRSPPCGLRSGTLATADGSRRAAGRAGSLHERRSVEMKTNRPTFALRASSTRRIEPSDVVVEEREQIPLAAAESAARMVERGVDDGVDALDEIRRSASGSPSVPGIQVSAPWAGRKPPRSDSGRCQQRSDGRRPEGAGRCSGRGTPWHP